MQNLDQLTESFKLKWDKFLVSCDALEEENDTWDLERYGEMDVYYEMALVSAILRLIAADGKITEQEADYLNRVFGFTYTREALEEVWDNCADNLDEEFDARLAGDIARLRCISEPLADRYAELVRLVCDILAESDGAVSESEAEAIASLRAITDTPAADA